MLAYFVRGAHLVSVFGWAAPLTILEMDFSGVGWLG